MSECSSNYITVELDEAKEIEKQLAEYERLEQEDKEDKIYRKKIVK